LAPGTLTDESLRDSASRISRKKPCTVIAAQAIMNVLSFAASSVPVLANGVNQIREGVLSILERFANSFFDHSAFKVNRLPGRRWQIRPCHVLKHPADLLQDLPGTFARCPGRFQFVKEILEFFRSHYVQLNTYMPALSIGIFLCPFQSLCSGTSWVLIAKINDVTRR
jgi:hypothetical protein